MSTPNAPGWYPDPGPGTRWRYWDGQHWTQHTSGAHPTGTVSAPTPCIHAEKTGQPQRRPPARRRLIALTMVAVLVLGIALGIALWLTVPNASVAEKSLDSVHWSRVPHDQAAFGGAGRNAMMTSVAAGPDGLVAVGSAWNSDKDQYIASAWTSDDGSSWERVPHDDAVFGSPTDGSNMWSVTTGGPGFVAVGGDHLGTGKGSVAAVWTSTDGTEWQRVPHRDVFGRQEDDATMRAVTAGGSGLVAVGHTKRSAAVWTSKDGRKWTRAEHRDSAFEPPGHATMQTVTPGGSGLIAGGFEELPGYGQVAALWTSKDGNTWTRVHHDDTKFGKISGNTEVRSVAARGRNIVAVGHAEGTSTAHAVVWTSKDGKAWKRLPHNEAVLGNREHYTTMIDISATRQGFLAVGAGTDHAQGNVHASIWISKDVERWQRVRSKEAFGEQASASSEIWSVASTRQELIAVGSAREYGRTNSTGAAWTGE